MSAALLYGVKNKGGVLVLAFELMSAKFQSVTWQSVASPLLLQKYMYLIYALYLVEQYSILQCEWPELPARDCQTDRDAGYKNM